MGGGVFSQIATRVKFHKEKKKKRVFFFFFEDRAELVWTKASIGCVPSKTSRSNQ